LNQEAEAHQEVLTEAAEVDAEDSVAAVAVAAVSVVVSNKAHPLLSLK